MLYHMLKHLGAYVLSPMFYIDSKMLYVDISLESPIAQEAEKEISVLCRQSVELASLLLYEAGKMLLVFV